MELKDIDIRLKDKGALNRKRAVHAIYNHDDRPSYITLLHLKQIVRAKCCHQGILLESSKILKDIIHLLVDINYLRCTNKTLLHAIAASIFFLSIKAALS